MRSLRYLISASRPASRHCVAAARVRLFSRGRRIYCCRYHLRRRRLLAQRTQTCCRSKYPSFPLGGDTCRPFESRRRHSKSRLAKAPKASERKRRRRRRQLPVAPKVSCALVARLGQYIAFIRRSSSSSSSIERISSTRRLRATTCCWLPFAAGRDGIHSRWNPCAASQAFRAAAHHKCPHRRRP